MAVEILQRSLIGLGISALITFGALSVLVGMDISVPISELWKHMLGSMIIGLYFGTSSLIFEYEKWSPLKQLVSHFLLSITAYFTVAIFTGWVSMTAAVASIAAACFAVIYFIIWFAMRSYLKRMESAMNSSLRK